jgi:hypothetical protein
MKLKIFVRLLALLGLISTSGCLVHEGRGGEGDHHWHGYGHEEQWDHHEWH